MSWIRSMSWTHVVDNSHSSGDVVGPRGVVDPRRGTHVCRGGMSWVTTMSWMYVVGHTLFHEHVVGTDVVCRGYCYVVDAHTHVVGVCRGAHAFSRACRGD